MKYNIATIRCADVEQWQVDLLTQSLADIGFDSFEQDGDYVRAYIPSSQLSAISGQQSVTGRLEEVIAESGAALESFEACADENWNAVWESEHETEELPLGVRITPHCAFGAGHHETTAMMVEQLLTFGADRSEFDIRSVHVLDMGTGTGVLAIMAAKLGAGQVLAVDIDENSVSNAQENALANGVQIQVLQASEVPEGKYGLIMANIHRNILLAQMCDYARTLVSGGELWLSGFYEADIPALTEAACMYGLHHSATRAKGEWRMLILKK